MKSATQGNDKKYAKLREELKGLKMDSVPNIARSHSNVATLWWLTILIASAGCCLFLTVDSIHIYLKYRVSTKKRLYFERNVVLPTITICPRVPFNTDYAAELLVKANAHVTNIDAQATDVLAQLENYQKNTTGSYLSVEQKQMLTNISTMFINFQFGYTTTISSSAIFQWIWHPIYLNCYRLNSGFNSSNQKAPLQQVTLAGDNSNLIARFYTGLPNTVSNMYTPSFRGIYVFIQNSTDYPLNPLEPYVLVTPGFGTRISVTRSFNSQFNEWPYTYSECRVGADNELLGDFLKDKFLFEAVLSTNYTYTRNTCELFCVQEIIAANCHCNSIRIDFQIDSYGYCLTEDELKCAKQNLETFYSSPVISEQCLVKCPLECAQQSFVKAITYYRYPSLYDVSTETCASLNQTDCNTNLLKNVVSVSVYYDSLIYSQISEEAAMTAESLLGLLGGHFHLFLGMSLLSFVEVGQLVGSYAFECMFYKKKKANK